MRRLGWHEIHKATWGDGTLTVVAADTSPLLDGSDIAVSVDTAAESCRLEDPGELPRRVRERVTASVAYTSLHQLAPVARSAWSAGASPAVTGCRGPSGTKAGSIRVIRAVIAADRGAGPGRPRVH